MSAAPTAERIAQWTRRWMDQGTALFLAAVDRSDDEDLGAATSLDGWSRRHLIAHVAANANALGRLARWAATGEETLMYSSPEQRNNDIEEGSRLAAKDLRGWLATSADQLAQGLDGLSDDDWSREVVTAQGRTVPATEIPWMRAREVMVHVVDLGAEVSFADLPGDFLRALVDDVVTKRSAGANRHAIEVRATDAGTAWQIDGVGSQVITRGSLVDIATWLTGRGGALIETADGGTVPELPAWL